MRTDIIEPNKKPDGAAPDGAPFLYRALRGLFTLSLHAFYNTILVRHPENMPPDGVPTLLCPNHSNSLTDGILMVTSAPRHRRMVRMTAKDTLWDHPIYGFFIRSVGTVPLQRKKDHAGPIDNTQSKNRIGEALAHGDCVCIFPEGISRYHASLAPVRTGVASMALSALEQIGSNDASVYIIPCGVTYLHRQRFRSSLVVEYGKPIVIGAAEVAAMADPRVEITERLVSALRSITYDAPDWGTVRVAKMARSLYSPPSVRIGLGTHVDLTRAFMEAFAPLSNVEASAGTPPSLPIPRKRLEALRDDLLTYKSILKNHEITDAVLAERGRVSGVSLWAEMVARSVMATFLLSISLPGLFTLSPMLLLAKSQERKVLGRPGAEEQNLDEVAQYKMLIAIFTLFPMLFLLVLITWPLAPFTFVVIPLTWWMSIRWCEDGMASLRVLYCIWRLWTILPVDLAALLDMREGLVPRVADLAEKIGLPREVFTLEDGGRRGWWSRLGWFDLRGRRIRDWEEVLRPYDVEED